MSVIIRGLSKPENCFSCPFFDVYSPTRSSGDEDYQCDLFVSLDYWQAAGKADKACPLVEIPTPHGPLVDSDHLSDIALHLMHTAKNDYIANGVKWLWQYIIESTTVIESEDGDP